MTPLTAPGHRGTVPGVAIGRVSPAVRRRGRLRRAASGLPWSRRPAGRVRPVPQGERCFPRPLARVRAPARRHLPPWIRRCPARLGPPPPPQARPLPARPLPADLRSGAPRPAGCRTPVRSPSPPAARPAVAGPPGLALPRAGPDPMPHNDQNRPADPRIPWRRTGCPAVPDRPVERRSRSGGESPTVPGPESDRRPVIDRRWLTGRRRAIDREPGNGRRRAAERLLVMAAPAPKSSPGQARAVAGPTRGAPLPAGPTLVGASPTAARLGRPSGLPVTPRGGRARHPG
jgi:hypothetical protein